MQIKFVDAAGSEHLVDAEPGENAMRCATRHSILGIVGECGGALACATCHGYVADEWASKLPPPSELEREMLEGCIDVQPNSRLTCQLKLEPALDGLVIQVANSQT
jgi:ferredoxin, 2Fe-2S